MKKIFILISFVLLALGAKAQEDSEQQSYAFKFVRGNDMFYIPFHNNEMNLDDFVSLINENQELLKDGYAYIYVASYATSGNEEQSPAQISVVERNRVKSELITRGAAVEQMFVTDGYNSAPLGDQRNVVVLTFPAPIEKVREILGDEKADRIVEYYRNIEQERLRGEKAEQDRLAAIKAAQEEQARQRAAEEQARQKAEQEELERQREAQTQTVVVEQPTTKESSLHLRTNVARLATLAADLGVEYKFSNKLSAVVHGTYADRKLDDGNGRYAQWQISPELRYYFAKSHKPYIGLQYQIGEGDFKNFLLASDPELGYQSSEHYNSFGLVAGYALALSDAFSLDLGIGAGYTKFPFDSYKHINGVRVFQGSDTREYFGINQVSVTLSWKICK